MDENISSKLLNYQIPHVLQMYEIFLVNNCILDASDTGTGKTYTSLALAKMLNKNPFVICPKSVIPSWISAAKYFDISLFGISNYEMLKGCKYYTSDLEKVICPYMDIKNVDLQTLNGSKKTKKELKNNKLDFDFYLPDNVIVIFDEAHRCKNYHSVTSRLLLSIKKANQKLLLLSATITDKITCFKPFGVVLDFYDDIKKFNMWIRRKQIMNKIKYKLWTDDDKIKLDIINTSIFPDKGSRLKIKELGDLFPKNQIVSQSYLCSDYDKVQKLYEVINDALDELKKKETKAVALGKIIMARQKIEMYKVPIFLDLTEDAIENGYSVVIFVNYLETMNMLSYNLKTDCLIHGGQNMDERQSCIEDFQSNKCRILISIIQAGGVGISLHDIHGNHPRMSLISPTWTGHEIKQALGRIYRAGSKTPALQRIIYCAKTYEDELCKIIDKKIGVIDAINDGDILGPQFDIELMTEIQNGEEKEEKFLKKKKKGKGEKGEKDENIIKLKKTKKIFIKVIKNKNT